MEQLSKHPLFAVLRREIDRIAKNPAYRFLLFTGPVIGILLMFFIFKQGTPRELPLAVVDHDHSTLSVKMTNAIHSAADVDVIVEPVDLFEAQKLLKQGEIDAIVFFPEDTEKKVYQGIAANVPVYINGTNVLAAGIVQRSVLTTLKTYSAGIQLKKQMMSGKNRSQAMARVMPVQIQKHVLFNPYSNYSYFLNSAMLYIMLYLFVMLSAIYTFGNELKRGTGESLLAASNNSVRLAVAAKMLPYTVIFCGFAAFINFLLYKIDGLPLNGNFLLIFGGQFITIITYQLMGVMLIAITSNLRLSLSMGSAYSMMAVTFSGLTFPVEGMPAFIKFLTALFPFTWWEKIVLSQSLRGAPVREALPFLCYILIFWVVALCFLPLYKRCLGNPKYWGKL